MPVAVRGEEFGEGDEDRDDEDEVEVEGLLLWFWGKARGGTVVCCLRCRHETGAEAD